jgi:unsaturated chondroitin disaccharide hydrolase
MTSPPSFLEAEPCRMYRFLTSTCGPLERVRRRQHQALGALFPTVGEESRYQLTENDHWLIGFWTGLLWLAYAAMGDEQLCAHAEALLPSFERRLDKQVHITHDLEFLFTLSARAQWEITGDQTALRAARASGCSGCSLYRDPTRGPGMPDFWGP